MEKYTKSLTTDFSSNLKLDQFHQEIVDSGITTEFIGITNTEDVVDILFANTLSAGEITTLNTLISNHVPTTIIRRDKFFIVTPKQTSIKSSNYFLCTKFNYPGTAETGSIDYIEIVSYIESTMTSYSVKVIDSSTDLTIAEKTGITNTISEAIDLGTISNLPSTSSIFELHIKTVGATGNNFVIVDNLIVYYDNA